MRSIGIIYSRLYVTLPYMTFKGGTSYIILEYIGNVNVDTQFRWPYIAVVGIRKCN